MSRPTAISPEEQEQIARRIGVLLLQGAPEDWQQVTVEYRATGEYHDLLGEIARQDGSTQQWEPPEELWGIFEHLREGMYRPDVGTWLSALYIVERPSSYRIDINFDEEPQWQQPLPRAAYVDELRRYPRSDDNVPDWMRDKLEGSSGSGASRQPAELAEPVDTAPQTPAQDGVASAPLGTSTRQDAPRDAHQNAESPAAVEHGTAPEHFRTARVFDGLDEHGRPVVTGRMPVQPEDSAALRQYLENAPIVLASRDNEPDQLDPDQPVVVPSTWHTDGVWLWQGAVAYYLAQYGLPPEPDFTEHIRSRRFELTDIDDRTRDAAVDMLTGSTELDGERSETFERADEPTEDGPVLDTRGQVPAAPEPAETPVPPPETDSTVTADLPGGTVAEDSDADLVAGDLAAGNPTAGDLAAGNLADSRTSMDPEPHSREDSEAIESVPELARIDDPATDSVGDGRAEQATPESGNELAAEEAVVEREPDELPGEAITASRHGRADEDDELDSLDSEVIFDELRGRLSGLAVDEEDYRIGERDESAWSLLDEGSDWVVAGPPSAPSELRFTRPDQAAAYLLGSLLMARTPHDAPSDAPQAEPPRVRTDSAEPEVPAEPAEHNAPEEAGTPPESSAAAAAPNEQSTVSADLPLRQAPEPAAEDDRVSGNFLFTANEDRRRQEQEAAAAEDREPSDGGIGHDHADPADPAPQAAPPSPPAGQPTQAPPPAAPGPAGVPPAGQVPPPLPKRPPRSDRGGPAVPPEGANPQPPQSAPPQPAPPQQPPAQQQPPQPPRPPQQPAPGPPPPAGPVPGAPGADQRRAGHPAPGGAPQQPQPPAGGPGDQRGNGPLNRPPQTGGPNTGGPAPQPAANQAAARGAEQPIQPLGGEPPLTLYRDRRSIVLQPGTDLDRFGEPNGNVLYAIRTPYTQRSLPPQWANRSYLAYRVQRPVQVLRGTAVPWFEQAGGGTAYVLPAAVGDLVADGTLIALTGSEAPPRPPME